MACDSCGVQMYSTINCIIVSLARVAAASRLYKTNRVYRRVVSCQWSERQNSFVKHKFEFIFMYAYSNSPKVPKELKTQYFPKITDGIIIIQQSATSHPQSLKPAYGQP